LSGSRFFRATFKVGLHMRQEGDDGSRVLLLESLNFRNRIECGRVEVYADPLRI